MIERLLLCVGAQKTGTTWLHQQLSNHSDVGFSNVKEVHYFNTIHNNSILLSKRKVDYLKALIENNRYVLEKYFTDISIGKEADRGINKLLSAVDDQWYENLFLDSKAKYCADFSPEYALLPHAGFEHIKKISRSQKIIFIMRDPVARAKSAIRYFFKTNGININEKSLAEIHEIAKKSFILNMSKYEKTIQVLDFHFSPDNILYLFYEDIMGDKQKSIDIVTDFLDITRTHISTEQLEKRVNATESYLFDSSIDEYLEIELSDTYKFLSDRFSMNY